MGPAIAAATEQRFGEGASSVQQRLGPHVFDGLRPEYAVRLEALRRSPTAIFDPSGIRREPGTTRARAPFEHHQRHASRSAEAQAKAKPTTSGE